MGRLWFVLALFSTTASRLTLIAGLGLFCLEVMRNQTVDVALAERGVA